MDGLADLDIECHLLFDLALESRLDIFGQVAVYPADCGTPVFGPVDVEVGDGEVLTAVAAGELEPEGDEPGFTPVLAYEAAAPFGGDRS